MFGEFFKLELRSAFKSPMVYVFFFLVALMSFGAVGSDNVTIGESVGNVYRNSPHSLTIFILILGVFGLLFATAFFNSAALRDHNNQFNEIMFSLPIKKGGYFWGRFLGALLLSTIPMLGVFFGAWLGSIIGPAAGWIDADKIGPFYLETLLSNYFMFVLPNMFVAGSIIFFLAHHFKSTIISFVGAMGLIVGYFASEALISDIDNETIGGILDSFGVRTYTVYSQYFTPAERNTLSPKFEGILLLNRLLWLAVGAVVSIASYSAFTFREKLKYRKRKAVQIEESPSPKASIQPQVSQSFSAHLTWKQFVSFFTTSFISIVKSPSFKILSFFGVLILFITLLEGYESFGLQSYPLTYKVIDDIDSATSIFIIIIVVFFSGELVWRDRSSHIEEVINATPHSSFASTLGKVGSLVVAATLLQFVYILMGIVSQVMRGYYSIELDVYLVSFFVESFPSYIVFASLFVFIQTLVKNRYVGYFAGILFFFTWGILINSVLEWSSRMWLPGSIPGIFYSDMNRFGPGLVGSHWFNVYWLLFAAILLSAAALFWPRTSVSNFMQKMKTARANFTGGFKTFTLAIIGLWLVSGGWVYYNTQVLNAYPGAYESEQNSLNYELKYKKYEGYPAPELTSLTYEMDIYPEERDFFTRTKALFVNDEPEPLDSLFFSVDYRIDTDIVIPGAKLVMKDSLLGFWIFALDKPWQPGESKEIIINADYVTKGFSNDRGWSRIVSNGTFLDNSSFLPSVGYTSSFELSDKSDRKKYGLPEKERTPRLETPCSDLCMRNYITSDISHWVDVESIISTSSDQIAIAPGSLVKEWKEGDRRFFHYKVDQPSLNFFSVASARYEVARDKYNDIDIEIYYHKGHEMNVQMMIDAVKRSLAYFEENFGPYYHKQARIIEFPRYQSFAQAFPGTMPYSEAIGFIYNLEDENENNIVDAVIAHEMAHQWWAHQETPAEMQGGTMLTESFAEYSSLMTLKLDADDIKMKNFLDYDFRRYLRGRTSEEEKELPLYQVENQGYIHYGKGSVILYALQDYIGQDSVNAALKDFLEEYRYADPPYPNAHDFLGYLAPRVPDTLQYLIDDWFKEITLYDFRLKEARARKLASGKYEIEMDVFARKLYADSLGNETEAQLKEWVDIGVYADSDEEELMAWRRVRFDERESTVRMIVDSLPVKAAVDPRRILIERVTSDNVKPVDES